MKGKKRGERVLPNDSLFICVQQKCPHFGCLVYDRTRTRTLTPDTIQTSYGGVVNVNVWETLELEKQRKYNMTGGFQFLSLNLEFVFRSEVRDLNRNGNLRRLVTGKENFYFGKTWNFRKVTTRYGFTVYPLTRLFSGKKGITNVIPRVSSQAALVKLTAIETTV